MNKSKGSPRKFSEKIALLNKNEAEGNAVFENVIKEVVEITRAPTGNNAYSNSVPSTNSNWVDLQYQDDTLNSRAQAQAQVASPHLFIHYNDNELQLDDNLETVQRMRHTTANNINPQTATVTSATTLVPNIRISPIAEETATSNYHHQQYQQVAATNISSNLISSARSLPDIANLHVSGSFGSMAPSYSDQRIQQDEYDYTYDVDNTISSTTNYISQTMESNSAPYEMNLPWQATNCNQQNYQNTPDVVQKQDLYQNQHHLIQQQQPQQQQNPNPIYYHEPDSVLIARANSTNAVSNDWINNNTNNASLCTPKINSNLSRSSDGCYNNLYYDQPLSNCDTSSMVIGHRFRSSSYNNIGSINSQAETAGVPRCQQTFIDSQRFYS